MADKYEIIIKKNGDVKSHIETNCALIVCNHSAEKDRIISFGSEVSFEDKADVFLAATKYINAIVKKDMRVGMFYMLGLLKELENSKSKPPQETHLDLDFFRKLKFSESDNEEGDEE